MPLAGFSEDDVPLAIGYYLGLRWFQAMQVTHGRFSITAQLDGGVSMQCDCGEITHGVGLAELEDWYTTHCASSGIVLNGARGRWEPGVNLAVCGAGNRHRAPDRECGCGFWSYWRLGNQQAASPHVAALVKGSGKIIKGPVGFRSEKAEILALLVPYGSYQTVSYSNLSDEGTLLASMLEKAFKVPVYRAIEDLLEKHTAPEGQPPLGDDWFSRGSTNTYHPGGVIGGSGYARGGSTTWNNVTGGSGSSYTYIHSGSGGGSSSAAGGGGGNSSVFSALGSGAMPCKTCGAMACAVGQADCARCQLRQVTSKVTEIEAKIAVAKEAAKKATTGWEALGQLAARKAAWALEPKGVMGPPDPPMGVSGIDSTGRRNPPGHVTRAVIDWMKSQIKTRHG